MKNEGLMKKVIKQVNSLKQNGKGRAYPIELCKDLSQLRDTYSYRDIAKLTGIPRSSLPAIVNRHSNGNKAPKSSSSKSDIKFLQLNPKDFERCTGHKSSFNHNQKVFMKLTTKTGIVVELYE